MSHHKHTVTGEGFTAEVKVPKEDSSGEWTAKVRLEDDGQRGKNVTLTADGPEELSQRLNWFVHAFSATQAEVERLAAALPPPVPEPPTSF